jgi:hypothetical protein
MHCDEVIRELAVPTDDRDSTALGEHLADCVSCARWARRAALLDRLWDATRAPEPTPETWEDAWSNLSRSLDLRKSKSIGSFHPNIQTLGQPREATDGRGQSRTASNSSRWSFAVMACIGLAQAAAVLLAVGLAWKTSSGPLPDQLGKVSSPTRVAPVDLRVAGTIEIEEGHIVLIETQGQVKKVTLPLCLSSLTMVQVTAEVPAFRVIDRIPEGVSFGVDDLYEMFNALEGIDNPIVALR